VGEAETAGDAHRQIGVGRRLVRNPPARLRVADTADEPNTVGHLGAERAALFSLEEHADGILPRLGHPGRKI
jgi:hypothetical protein